MASISNPVVTISNHPSEILENQGLKLIASVQGLNLNKVGDTIVSVPNISKWRAFALVGANASTNLTTATITVNTGANVTGEQVIGTTALSGLINSNKVLTQITVGTTNSQTTNRLYFNVGVAQGTPATADFYLYGFDLTFLS